MAKIFKASLTASVAYTHSNQPDEDGPITTDNNTWRLSGLLANGTGNYQGRSAFHDIQSLNGGSIGGVSLQGGSRDGFGDLITFTAIKFIGIKHLTPEASAGLKIGGGSDPFPGWTLSTTDQPIIRPGGAFIWWGPLAGAVLSGSAELQIENLASGAVSYEVCIMGTVAS